MTIILFGGKRGGIASRRTPSQPWSSNMLWGCFAAGGTGALHKIDGIMRREHFVDILKQHLNTSVRKLKLGRQWVFPFAMAPSILRKLWQNGLRTTKSRYWSGHHKALTSMYLSMYLYVNFRLQLYTVYRKLTLHPKMKLHGKRNGVLK